MPWTTSAKQWSEKPLMIVTYGGHGGDKCAGQLRQVAGGLKMRPVDPMPAITVAREAIENDTPQSLEDLKPFEASAQKGLCRNERFARRIQMSNRITAHQTDRRRGYQAPDFNH
jgi:NAD(P)H-dependent FMN reductase